MHRPYEVKAAAPNVFCRLNSHMPALQERPLGCRGWEVVCMLNPAGRVGRGMA